MDILKTVILLCYLLSTFLAIVGITMSALAKKKIKSDLNNALLLFLSGMLIMCFYDWFIYYQNYSFMGVSNTLALRLGSCLIAVLFYLWTNL